MKWHLVSWGIFLGLKTNVIVVVLQSVGHDYRAINAVAEPAILKLQVVWRDRIGLTVKVHLTMRSGRVFQHIVIIVVFSYLGI